ncbi:hypothetical protein CVIRNUC_004654, partial [Coccomyxa viridis]
MLWKDMYKNVSMSYLWIGPPLAWLCFDERSLLAPWAAFTIVTSFLLGTCLFDHRDAACRGVSSRLQHLYVVNMGVGLASLPLSILEIFDYTVRSSPSPWLCWEVLLWTLYFGVLTRECAGQAKKYLASNVANQALAGIPGACGMCGDALPPGSIQLGCNHYFHAVCIHGHVLYGCK